jgi:hypothetical protein
MKKLLMTLVALNSWNAFATAPARETVDLARILLNNPGISKKLTSRCLDQLADFTKAPVEDGVDKYTLKFRIGGYCEPVKATVEIVEDLRPTRTDGPAEYKVESFQIEAE